MQKILAFEVVKEGMVGDPLFEIDIRCDGMCIDVDGNIYTTSKGGLAALTFSLARESAGDGVTANAIAPGYIMTRMVTEQLTEAQRRKLLAEIPVGRFCEPAEIAHVVRFLVSPLAGFITGEIIDINGGLHLD